MRTPTVYTEADALNNIRAALDECDLDQLAQILSQIVETNGPVVVVHDGCEATTAAEVGADDSIPVSSAYENGDLLGDLLEDGTVEDDNGELDAFDPKKN